MSPTKAHGAEFFAVASGVQIPYVGRDETGLNASRISTPPFPDDYPSRLAQSSLAPLLPSFGVPHWQKLSTKDEGSLAKLADVYTQYHPVTDKSSKDISRSYLKKISTGLVFNEDVLQDRAPHTLPYNEDELNTVFRTGGLCHAKGPSIGLVGRHDIRGVVKRHALCHLKGPRKLKPLRRSKTLPAITDTGRAITVTTKPKVTQSFTENTLSQGSSQHEWDEFVLACLSKSTAQWIISEQSTGSDKERLSSFYEKRIKETEEETLPSKELSEGATVNKKQTSAKKKLTEIKEKKSQQALEIHYTPSFTLSPAVGSKKLETDNIFQQELLGGAQPVSSKKNSDSSVIVLDTNDKLKFQKQLQENYPQDSKVWYSSKGSSAKAKEKPQKKPKKLVKGLQRWKELPVVVQVNAHFYLEGNKCKIH